ncbi:MAG: rhodanese-like domain-containing protein [Candidatus Izemoplasmatales bacterium]|jgi:rhodanese-related sulfurtransferase
MFLAVWEWVLPIGIGLLVGILISMRRRNDYTQIVMLDAEEFRLNMRKGQLLDLRGENDFSSERINGSRNFPKRSLFQSLSKIRRDQAVFLYDKTGSGLVRSVAKKLIRKGYRPIYVLKGGLDTWTFPLK